MSADSGTRGNDVLLVQAPSPEVLVTVRESCVRAAVQEADLCRAFFRNLADLSPASGQDDEDRAWMISDIWVRWVLWAALCDASASTVESALHEVGGQLGRAGLAPEWFRPANSALLRAMRTLHPDWGTGLSSCWVCFLGWIGAHAAAGVAEIVQVAQPAGGSPDGSTEPLAWPHGDQNSPPASAEHGTGRRRGAAFGNLARDLLSEIWCGLPRIEAD